MEFQVPQFIEREIRIAGPLTFKQFLFVIFGGALVFFLYFVLAQKSFLLFLLLTIIIVAAIVSLAFLNVQGVSLPTVIINFFTFTFSSKIYFWQKKAVTPKLIEMPKIQPEKTEKTPALTPTRKSQLENLSSRLEIGTK